MLTEKRRATCSGHEVRAVRVTKRWWTCEACGWRLSTLRELLPSKRCPKCRDPEKLFKAASAHGGTRALPPAACGVNADGSGVADPIASRGGMLPRGVEQPFCLNSLQG
jgi:hypothetical protein